MVEEEQHRDAKAEEEQVATGNPATGTMSAVAVKVVKVHIFKPTGKHHGQQSLSRAHRASFEGDERYCSKLCGCWDTVSEGEE